jgi:hypothetical protein
MLSNLNREQELSRLRRNEAISRAKQSSEMQAVKANVPTRSSNRPVLAKVGQVLSTIGDSLQQRYGESPQQVKYIS